jgi:hypothetical protein
MPQWAARSSQLIAFHATETCTLWLIKKHSKLGVRMANDFPFQPVKHVAAWFCEGIIEQVQQGGKKIHVFWVNFQKGSYQIGIYFEGKKYEL